MSYIEKYFQDIGFNIQQIEFAEYEALVDNYRVTNTSTGWITFFKWREVNDNQAYWESISGRLRLILESEIAFDKSKIYNNESLLQFIDAHNPILTPDEKLNNILQYIRKQTSYDGEAIAVYYADPKVLTALKFLNKEECVFYFVAAVKKGFLDSAPIDSWANYLSLTTDGLNRIIKEVQSKESRYCFVAMSFDNELDTIYANAIEPAVIATGFIPIRVDRIYVDSDKTINDEIIAGIKKSRFTIADFTHHKAGVYFEAGYALGRTQKVIYTCRQDEISKAHFDIRNYQHIVWTDAEDLKKRLVNKIEAFIKD
jgi:hypothetical protein